MSIPPQPPPPATLRLLPCAKLQEARLWLPLQRMQRPIGLIGLGGAGASGIWMEEEEEAEEGMGRCRRGWGRR